MRDPLKWLLALCLFVAGIAWTYAAPIAVAEDQGIKITLTDEKCALKGVSNLPFRLTWKDQTKTYEGCYAPQAGLVVMFFEDLSVVVAPGRMFRPVTSL